MLQEKTKELEGQIRDLRNRLFGKKSERKSSSKKDGEPKPTNYPEEPPKRPRGQQPGARGHGRTKRPHLPQKKESIHFHKTPACSECGELYILDESEEQSAWRRLFDS